MQRALGFVDQPDDPMQPGPAEQPALPVGNPAEHQSATRPTRPVVRSHQHPETRHVDRIDMSDVDQQVAAAGVDRGLQDGADPADRGDVEPPGEHDESPRDRCVHGHAHQLPHRAGDGANSRCYATPILDPSPATRATARATGSPAAPPTGLIGYLWSVRPSALAGTDPADRLGLPPRTRLAARVGGLVGALSRAVGAGAGSVIAGRATLLVDPQALGRLAAGRRVALVSGTNGKTTTTALLAAALGSCHPVVTNANGSNMLAGLTAAAARDRSAELVLEVDEPHLPAVLAATRPSTVILLNISRDQLDRVAETRNVAGRWRAALRSLPAGATVVANADDPLVTWAAETATTISWVAAGQHWQLDSLLCPRCGQVLDREPAGEWACSCGARRPVADWRVDGDVVEGAGFRLPLELGLPGRANRSNAVMVLAAAHSCGVPVQRALEAVRAVRSVGGRYWTGPVGGRPIRLLLAKNPAGWAETLDLLADERSPVIVAINARLADGRDPSWLWDVPFEQLRGRPVVASGERRHDLAVRLEVAGVPPAIAEHPLDGLVGLPPGRVDVVANYTAFQDLRREIDRG